MRSALAMFGGLHISLVLHTQKSVPFRIDFSHLDLASISDLHTI